jgi:uroporphyrinogen-III synthase
MVKKLFITKNIDELSELPAFCEKNNIEIIASSLICFESLPFILNAEYEVILFSSIRAANFFIEKQHVPEGVEIACVGSTTAQKLEQIGFEISFIGNKSGLPEVVAEDFLKWLGERKVLIPCSKQSKRTISSRIPLNQLVEIEVYKTLSKCQSIPPSDCYIFTSPSNFEAFLSCHPKPQGTIIAWGTTTENAMLDRGVFPSFTLKNSNEKELIDILQSNL